MTDRPAADKHPRGKSWCAEVTRPERHQDDPRWCWCGSEIVWGTGQCAECQEDADDD